MPSQRPYVPFLFVLIFASAAFAKPNAFRCTDFTGHYGSTNPNGKATIQCPDGTASCVLQMGENTGSITPDPDDVHGWLRSWKPGRRPARDRRTEVYVSQLQQ
jgi:hypothetical protein